MNDIKIEKTKYIQWSIVFVSFFLFIYGFSSYKYNLALLGIVCVWTTNIVYSFCRVQERILFLFFNLTFFVFLIVNPILAMISGETWWERFWPEAENFSLIGIYLSLLSLYLGACIYDFAGERVKRGCMVPKVSFPEKYLSYIQVVSLAGYVIAWLFKIILGVEKIIFMQGKIYTDYYKDFTSSAPYIFQVAASMMIYFMCIFLATKPDKKRSFFVLCMYILTTITDLIIGIRNPFVLSCIFSFLYYYMRDVEGKKEKWIGRFEKACLIIIPPIAVFSLGIYTYIRNGAEITIKGIGNVFRDFFFSQGSSFDVLAIGYGALPYLPDDPSKNYTFGGIIDYFTHGSIAQKFFGATPLPEGNNIVNALESNSFAHNMSYIAKGEEAYLAGEGFGSSYILETYADFGYVGVVVFSVILGVILLGLMKCAKKGILSFSIMLVTMTTIFFTPRAEALGWIQFILYLQFWLPVMACLTGAVALEWFEKKLKRFKYEE